ncbi:hypothetical protein ACFL6C_14325, partial [Myxococcota bacterium]
MWGIFKDMMANGWRGRPLLAIALGEECQALTGSHRLEAAREAAKRDNGSGYTVPVRIISTDNMDKETREKICRASDDRERLRALINADVDEDAIELMRQEVLSNAKDG